MGVSIDAKPSMTLKVYPNPTSESLHIETPSASVTISDALGRTLISAHAVSDLDVSRLPAGVYYINAGTSRARFVKE